MITLKPSSSKKSENGSVIFLTSNSNDASAASNWNPSFSRLLSLSTISVTLAPISRYQNQAPLIYKAHCFYQKDPTLTPVVYYQRFQAGYARRLFHFSVRHSRERPPCEQKHFGR